MKINIRNDTPTTSVRTTDMAFFRMAQSGIKTLWSEIQAGTPIGLLLTLTYAQVVTIPTVYKGEIPNVSIRTTD